MRDDLAGQGKSSVLTHSPTRLHAFRGKDCGGPVSAVSPGVGDVVVFPLVLLFRGEDTCAHTG